MSKVFFSVSMSLDGFIGPDVTDDQEAMTRQPSAPVDGKEVASPTTGRVTFAGDSARQWMALQGWAFQQRFFRENLHLGESGETGQDNAILEQTFNRTGVTIIGKRMFDAGEIGWPEDAPFHTPVFVLTHEVREPWERPGGTTFYFVNDGIESALRQAREVAGDRDIRIGGGAEAIGQYLNAGLIDECSIALAPVLLGSGVRLFDGVDRRQFSLEIQEAIHSPLVTHLNYTVRRRAD